MTAAFANFLDAPTGIDLAKLHHFPLTKIRSGRMKAGTRVSFDAITATAPAGRREVLPRGTGRSGKKWEANIADLDEVWRADLDGNGTQDYVFFSVGPYGNGRMAPSFSLSILLMDPEGLPVPFFTVVYHGENGDGIRHLVDLERDGHAELPIATYDEIPSDPHVEAFRSGHWTSQLYRFRNFGAEEIRGPMGGINFPLIHDWTDRGECPELEKPLSRAEPPILHEHGSSAQNEVKTTIRATDNSPYLTIAPVEGCNTINPQVMVYDQPRLREIAFPNPFSQFSTDMAERIRRAAAPVRLRGVDKWMGHGECSVNLLYCL